MKTKRKFFKRNKVTFLIVLMLLGYYGFLMYQTETKLDELKGVQKELKTEIAMIDRDIDKLEDEYIYSLSTEAVEQIARKRLKMVKPNEIIFLIKGLQDEGDGE